MRNHERARHSGYEEALARQELLRYDEGMTTL